jgi:putative endonuclease
MGAGTYSAVAQWYLPAGRQGAALVYLMPMDPYWVYAIHSERKPRIYVGMSRDVERRIREHNTGSVFSTKGYRPWTLIYKEVCGQRIEARKREKYLKSGIGKEFLKQFIPR